MKDLKKYQFLVCIFIGFLFFSVLNAQTTKNEFWDKVRFGGGLGLSIGNNFTDIMVAPSAIYQFNEYFAAGVGLQGSYIRVKDNYEAYTYGGSILALANPIEQIQLSAELEQIRVNLDYDNRYTGTQYTDNFWNTALFLGVGYNTPNVTIGVRYNVLHENKRNIYSEAFMPFIRIYF
jgi:long-subunit fatty acid transport protein